MNIIEISDLSSFELSVFTSKNESQLLHLNEPDMGVFIAESPYVINLALEAGYQPLSVLAKRDMLENDVIKKLENVPIFTANDSVLSSVTGFNLTYGLLCQMKRKKPKTVKEICESSKRIAIFEHIMNPTNIGAIIRSAAALGIDGVLLSHDCCDPLYRRSARVSMGCVFKMPYAFFDKGEGYRNIELVKKLGYKTVAMALTDSCVDISDPAIKCCPKLAIVLGSEGEGLTDQSVRACDFHVKIPMHKEIDSLNVGAAAAIAFWELTKQ